MATQKQIYKWRNIVNEGVTACEWLTAARRNLRNMAANKKTNTELGYAAYLAAGIPNSKAPEVWRKMHSDALYDSSWKRTNVLLETVGIKQLERVFRKHFKGEVARLEAKIKSIKLPRI